MTFIKCFLPFEHRNRRKTPKFRLGAMILLEQFTGHYDLATISSFNFTHEKGKNLTHVTLTTFNSRLKNQWRSNSASTEAAMSTRLHL